MYQRLQNNKQWSKKTTKFTKKQYFTASDSFYQALHKDHSKVMDAFVLALNLLEEICGLQRHQVFWLLVKGVPHVFQNVNPMHMRYLDRRGLLGTLCVNPESAHIDSTDVYRTLAGFTVFIILILEKYPTLNSANKPIPINELFWFLFYRKFCLLYHYAQQFKVERLDSSCPEFNKWLRVRELVEAHTLTGWTVLNSYRLDDCIFFHMIIEEGKFHFVDPFQYLGMFMLADWHQDKRSNKSAVCS